MRSVIRRRFVPLAMLSLACVSCEDQITNVTNNTTASTSKAWRLAELLESGANSAITPQVAFDPNGNAIAVWSQSDGTRYNLWANRYTAGSGWGVAALIETDNAGSTADPQIAFDSSGNAIAVWRQLDGVRYNLLANRYTAGSGWGVAALIETDNLGSAFDPQIAFDPSGNAIAVWSQSDGTRNNLWTNRYAAGSGWGVAALIETDNVGNALAPQIAFDPSGNAIAVWRQFDGSYDNIYSNRRAAGGDWDPAAAAVIETNTGNASSPQIAFDSSGNAIAIWSQNDGTYTSIYSNRRAAGGSWDSAAAAVIETNTENASNPQIAFDPSGNAIAVWGQGNGSNDNIYANRYVAGIGVWNVAVPIETTTGLALSPQIAFDPSGNAIAAWKQNDGTLYRLRVNRRAAGSGWGLTAETIDGNTGDVTGSPQVAFDSSGNAIAIWSQADVPGGIIYSIWAAQYR